MELPRHIGPYRVVTELTGNQYADSARKYVAHGPGPVNTVLLSVPPRAREHETAFHIRFRAEGEKARRLVGPAALPAVDVAPPDARLPWVAVPYVPAVPLPAALAANGGPLAETVICGLGASLAATLAANHANGLVYAGITMDTVLLAADGPRLIDFGAARAGGTQASPYGSWGAGAGPPPEAGKKEAFTPAGDVYALGMVLTGLATGRIHSSPEDVPELLRPILTAARAPDPAERPQADALAVELAVAQDGARLPEPLSELLDEQQAAVRAAQAADAEAWSGEKTTRPAEVASSGPPRRRAILVGTVAAAVGLVVGGAAAYAATREEEPARPERRRRVAGVAPSPLWQTRLPHGKGARAPVLWEGRVAVFPTARGAAGIDLRTGEQLWDRAEFTLKGDPMVFGSGQVLLPGSTFRTVEAENGEVQWEEDSFGKDGTLRPHRVLAAADGNVWFEAKGKGTRLGGASVVAYDVASRQHLWTSELSRPLSDSSALLRPDALLLQGDDDAYTALDRKSGKKLWSRKYKGIEAGADFRTTVLPQNRFVVCVEEALAAFDMSERRASWVFTSKSGTLGEALYHDKTIYVTDSFKTTYALDAGSGTVKWEKDNGTSNGLVSPSLKSPPTGLSHSRRTLLASNASSVDAYDAADGKLRWRFTPVSDGERMGYAGRMVGGAKGVVLVQNEDTVYALPVD